VSAVQQSVLQGELGVKIQGANADVVIEEVRRNATFILDLPATQKDASIESYSTSLHAVFLTGGVILVGATMLLSLLKEHPLSDTLVDENIEHTKLEEGDMDEAGESRELEVL